MVNVARRGPIVGVSRWRNRNDHIGVTVGADTVARAHGHEPRHRQDPAVAAQRAGDRGRVTPPMDVRRRTLAYQAQNGCGRLTPKQRRRINKKLTLELRRAFAKAGTP